MTPEEATIENRKSKIANAKAGFTIAELLIALAISAILLVAVAVAFNASAVNYQQNEDIFKVVNSARQALFRMTSQLRTADAVAHDAPINECSFITAADENITYQFRSAENKLYLITNIDSNEYVLCDNVTAMTFTKTAVVNEEGWWIVQSVQISITVASNNVEKTISAAAAIRRNLN